MGHGGDAAWLRLDAATIESKGTSALVGPDGWPGGPLVSGCPPAALDVWVRVLLLASIYDPRLVASRGVQLWGGCDTRTVRPMVWARYSLVTSHVIPKVLGRVKASPTAWAKSSHFAGTTLVFSV